MSTSKNKSQNALPTLSPEKVNSVIQQVYELAEVIVSANYFVVDVTFEIQEGEWLLTIYLDHPNHEVRVTIEDCRDISQALNPMLDENIKELNDFPYVLEVSSPGLFRELHHPREFNFYANRRAEIHIKKNYLLPNGTRLKEKQNYFATILGFDNTSTSVMLKPHTPAETHLEKINWPDNNVAISLSPDLTEEIEIKTVPRRINQHD